MYSGLMLLMPGCALVLGSAWGLAPITMLMATFIVRTVLEDGALRRELPGYDLVVRVSQARVGRVTPCAPGTASTARTE